MFRTRLDWCSLIIIIISAAIMTIAILPAKSHAGTIKFASPGEGVEVTTSKPPIVCEVSRPATAGTLLVLLDDADITGALDFTPQGFRFDPVQPLANGAHQVRVSIAFADGNEITQNFTFRTFSHLSGETKASATYEQVIDKSDELVNVPYHNFAANLGNTTTYARGNWQMGLITNLRWLDRSLPIFEPEKKGVDMVNYLLTGQYQHGDTRLQINAGDVQIQETPNTVMDLARRGIQARAGKAGLDLHGFVVQSRQLYGVRNDSGLELDDDNYVVGGSGGYSLLADKLRLRAIYAHGVESNSNSYGIYDTDNSKRRGSVLGLVAKSAWLGEKLNLEAEYDRSDYDADTADGLSAESDKAWVLVAGGSMGSYSYQAAYEYVGPQYEVIGNPLVQRDREGVAAMGAVREAAFSLSLSASRYEDNVDENKFYPQVEMTTAKMDYAYTRIPHLPFRMSYQKSIYDSSMVPEDELPYRVDTDLYGAGMSYLRGPWTFDVNAGYSSKNDKTESDYDTSAQNYGINATYYAEALSFAQNLAFNRSTDESTDTDTDTFTVTIDLLGNLLQGRVSYEFAGTFSRTRMSDDTLDVSTLNTNAMIAYHLRKTWADFFNPAVGVRVRYDYIDDRVQDRKDDAVALFLVLSSNMGVAF